MKYLKAEVLVAVPDSEVATWSEHADVTFFLGHLGLENRARGIFLVDHDDFPKITEDEFNQHHKCFTEEGGV